MFKILTGLLALTICCMTAFGQSAKGVDKQNERVRDGGTNRTAGNNGAKTIPAPGEESILAVEEHPRLPFFQIRIE
jgi:hypothetical protein